MFNYNIYQILFKNAFPIVPPIDQNGSQLQW